MHRMRRCISPVSSHPEVVGELVVLMALTDDADLYDGAHVSVQIVGRRFQEEKVLALTEILGDALGKHVV
jgi:Asp-tRNA(Asn)/Glu-tRNA(Gln) amidotransferase A subunit family amidase